MSLPRFSVQNSVFVNMIMVVILVAGGLFALTLVREMFPESRPDRLLIMAVYPAVQPEEIEKAVTIKVEEAVRDIEGVEKVDSTVQEGLSSTFLTLYNWVEDVDSVLQEVKNEIDALDSLPVDLEKITVSKVEPKLPVISVALYGPGDEAARKRAARQLRDELLLLPGISEVQISGTREDEISIEVRPERLLEYDVTFEEVAAAIRTSNLDVSGGRLKGDRATVAIRTLGEQQRGVDLEDIVVRSFSDGRKVLLEDVAEIRDAFVDVDLETYFNGEPSVNCTIFKTSSQDAIQIATLVKAFVAGKTGADFDPYGFDAAYEQPWYWRPLALIGAGSSRLLNAVSGRPDPLRYYEQSRKNPFDHKFTVLLHSDLSRFVEGRLDLMLRNGKSGLILVLISLYLFLNPRVAFWAAVGLPISFLGTFIVMWAFGLTINLLTMFGMIIVLGIIVDDAIVIGENIYRHVENGMPPMKAAVHGAEEVMWPVLIAVTTTMAAFAPLLFIKGQIGDFMGQLPLVIIAALSVSLLEALVILPAHLAHLPTKKQREARARTRPPGRIRRAVAAVRRFWNHLINDVVLSAYERVLRFTLNWRYVTVCTAVGALLISAGLFIGFTPAGPSLGNVVPWEFVQKMDSETLVAALEMPVGSTSDSVKERLSVISDAAESMPEVLSVQMIVARQYDIAGSGATLSSDQSHLGQLVIELKEADARERAGERSSTEVMAELREVSRRLAGVNSVTWEALSGGPGGKDIHIRISGDNFEELVAVAEQIKEELRGYDGVEDLDDDTDRGKREVRLELLKSAEPAGITVGALGNHVRGAMYGAEARRITRNREDVKIMVRYPERFRESAYNIESMYIPAVAESGERGWVPLDQVARLTEAEGYASIHRSQGQRSVSVLGEVDTERASVFAILDELRADFLPQIMEQHPRLRIEFLGSSEEQAKAFSSLKIAFPVALLLVFMLLAGLFRSYAQPTVVMMAIPFGFMGAIVGHWVTGYPMTVLSFIGLVALTGIVVNDSLVLIDFVNTRVRSGMSEYEASIQGAKLRLRPILLTTLTTVAGLTPLMFETSFQAKFMIPMAVTLTWGLTFATVLTLVILPSLNMIFFDARRVFRGTEDVEEERTEREPALEANAV